MMVRNGSRRQIWVVLVCLLLTAYFGYHALKGQHGLEAKATLVTRAERLTVELARLETVRSDLERDIALLDDRAIDPDYLDELARSSAGFARPGDIVILGPP
ncbi:MAG: septum formation initiator family protein [Hyphomicrobiaceae bacterium]